MITWDQNVKTIATAIKLVVVDDDEKFLDYISSIVSSAPTLKLMGTSTSLAEARLLIHSADFDVLLVDLGLPDGSGIDLIREVTTAFPNVDAMVLTVFGDESHVTASLEAGATGYILKRSLPSDFVETIAQLREGGSPISPVIARQLLTRFQRMPPKNIAGDSPPDSTDIERAVLSEREIEVLVFISKGFNLAEISRLLGISDHTVATYIKRIYRKLSVHSRTEALFEASRMGLL